MFLQVVFMLNWIQRSDGLHIAAPRWTFPNIRGLICNESRLSLWFQKEQEKVCEAALSIPLSALLGAPSVEAQE